jgi:type III secretion protein J
MFGFGTMMNESLRLPARHEGDAGTRTPSPLAHGRSHSPRSRNWTRSWHLLALLSLASLLAGCREPVLTARPEDEANTALATLSRAGLRAQKLDLGRGAFRVVVAGRDMDAALEVLSIAGLPRASEPGLAELFPEPGLVSSPAEERARYHLALSGELSASLRRLSGVRDARVHLGIPQERARRLDRSPQEPAKASVLLLAEPGETAELEGRADSIRELVAGAVSGLEAGAVSVVVTEARAMPVASSPKRAPRPMMLAAGAGTALLGIVMAVLLVLWRRRSFVEDV